jgi:hypothetical protein
VHTVSLLGIENIKPFRVAEESSSFHINNRLIKKFSILSYRYIIRSDPLGYAPKAGGSRESLGSSTCLGEHTKTETPF